MKSINLEVLRKDWLTLASLGGYYRPTVATVLHISPIKLWYFPLLMLQDYLVEKFGFVVRKAFETFAKHITTLNESNDLFASLSQRSFRGEL